MTADWSLPAAKAAVAGAAILLAGLAVWQGADSVGRLYGNASRNIEAGDDPATGTHDAALLEHLDDWLADPQARIRAGQLILRWAVLGRPNGPPDHGRLVRSIDDLRLGLARAPADSRAWMSLAQGELLTGEINKGKQAYRTALLMAVYDPTLAVWRSQMGLSLWPLLDEDDRRLVIIQLQQAWTHQPAELVRVAKQANAVGMVATLLGQDPDQKIAFEKAVGP